MYENKTITAPVSMSDIQRAVGLFRYHDIGGLVTYGYINKWSLHKPFAYPKIAFANETERLNAMREKNCGLSIPVYDSPFDLLNAIRENDENYEAWEYTRPTGGSLQPFRMGDFVGYYNGRETAFPDYEVTPKEIYAIDDYFAKQQGLVSIDSRLVQISDLAAMQNITPSGMETPYNAIILCPKGEVATNANSFVRTLDGGPDNPMIDGERILYTLHVNRDYVGCFFYSRIPIHDDNVFNQQSASHRQSFIPMPTPLCFFHSNSAFGLEFEGEFTGRQFSLYAVVNGERDKYTRERRVSQIVINYVGPDGSGVNRYSSDSSGNYQIPAVNTAFGDWAWNVLLDSDDDWMCSANGFRKVGNDNYLPRPFRAMSSLPLNGDFFATFTFVDDALRKHIFTHRCAVRSINQDRPEL